MITDDDKCVCCGEYTKDGMVCDRCKSKEIGVNQRSVLELGALEQAIRKIIREELARWDMWEKCCLKGYCCGCSFLNTDKCLLVEKERTRT